MVRLVFALLFAWNLWLSTAVAGEPEGSLVTGQRDSQLHSEAVRLAGQGDSIAAMRTLAAVKTPSVLAQAIRDVDSAVRQSAVNAGRSGSASSAEASGGRGGAIINFGPLVNLIQTTIAPDTWQETAGGPSIIAPFPGGIVVDPSGLITDVTQSPAEDDLLANIAVMLARDHREEADFASAKDGLEAWRLPSTVRCVSMRGVAEEIARRRLSGGPIDAELRHLAGISRVRYIVLDREKRDVLLVGRVDGIESHNGWLRDSQSGAIPLRVDHLAACLTAVISRQPLGCSIDPTPQSLATAANISAAVRDGKIAQEDAEEALREALGEQVVRVFGVAADTPIAYLMVQTDRHMKRLSLGLEPMPQGVDNYLDVVARHIRKGAPDGQLLRLWFTADPIAVRSSTDGRVFELGGRPMKLQSETQQAGAVGDRIAAADDVRLVEFVDEFNRHLDQIARHYPTYAALQSVYHAAAVAELIHRSDSHANLNQWLGPLLMDDPSAGSLNAPTRVASVAVRRTIREGGKHHSVFLASGGVVLQPEELISGKSETYPMLDNVALKAANSRDAGHWWWDVKR